MRILIADDHRVVREGVRWMLEPESGIEIVGEAVDGADLLRMVSETADVDLVLLDLRMPGLNGFEALEQLAEEAPDVKAVVMSMHDDPIFVRRAISLGASGYLLKNVGQAELVRALESAHEGHIYVQGELSGALIQGVDGDQSLGKSLGPREVEMLQLISDGASNKQIARDLNLSQATVKWCLKNVFAKLDVNSRAEAVASALRIGVIA